MTLAQERLERIRSSWWLWGEPRALVLGWELEVRGVLLCDTEGRDPWNLVSEIEPEWRVAIPPHEIPPMRTPFVTLRRYEREVYRLSSETDGGRLERVSPGLFLPIVVPLPAPWAVLLAIERLNAMRRRDLRRLAGDLALRLLQEMRE